MSTLKKPQRAPNENVRHILASARVNIKEMALIRSLAFKFTKGDLSKWMRYAALNFKPSKKDLDK